MRSYVCQAPPALVTPLDSNGEFWEDALRNVIDFTIAGGVHSIFVLSSSSEIYGLDNVQKRRVLEISAEHDNERVPLYVFASDSGHDA